MALARNGHSRIAGVDEAGRGPLAGPVVAAAVVLPEQFDASGITDSKLLTDHERRALAPRILAEATAVGVGVAHNDEIDRINILQATFRAMREALAEVEVDAVIVDGLHCIPQVDLKQWARPRADQTSLSVAAASIVAKVVRDEMMVRADRDFAGYGFAEHKGYATRAHFRALERYGPCPLHRQTFLVRWRERQRQSVLPL